MVQGLSYEVNFFAGQEGDNSLDVHNRKIRSEVTYLKMSFFSIRSAPKFLKSHYHNYYTIHIII